jgi:hypothetical protein
MLMNVTAGRDLPQSVSWDPNQKGWEVIMVCCLILSMVLRLFSLPGAAEPAFFRSLGLSWCAGASLSGPEKRATGDGA